MENTMPYIEGVGQGEDTPTVVAKTSFDIQAQQARIEKRVSQVTALIASADSEVGVGSPITYTTEEVVDHLGKRQGAEILLRCEGQDTFEVLEDIKIHGKSLDLFYRGLLEIFRRIIKGETGDISINAFVEDIKNKEFRHVVRTTMAKFKKEDRKRIIIEVVETPYGQPDQEFISNVIWLRSQGFRLSLDDYNILKIQDDKTNISRKLLKMIGHYCEKIKLDHTTTAALLKDPGLQRFIKTHRMRYDHSVTAEGIHSKGEIRTLSASIDRFQMSSHGILVPQNDDNYRLVI